MGLFGNFSTRRQKRTILLVFSLLLSVAVSAYAAQTVSVSIVNNTESLITQIEIQKIKDDNTSTFDKAKSKFAFDSKGKIERYTCSLNTGGVKSFDLIPNERYSIKLYDKENQCYDKQEILSFSKPWQKLEFFDKDFRAKDGATTFKKFLGIGSDGGKAEKTTAVIIENQTGETITAISYVQDKKTEPSISLSLKDGEQKTLDIKRNSKIDFTFLCGKKLVGKPTTYKKEGLKFKQDHTALVISAADKMQE